MIKSVVHKCDLLRDKHQHLTPLNKYTYKVTEEKLFG